MSTTTIKLAGTALLLALLGACGSRQQAFEASSLLMPPDDGTANEELVLAEGEELAPGQTQEEQLETLTALPAATVNTTIWVDDDGVQAAALGIKNAIQNSSTKSGISLALEKAKTITEGNIYIRVLPGTYPGQVYIERSNLALIAHTSLTAEVNSAATLATAKSITNWPVKINSIGDGITASSGRKNVVVRGFYITKANLNGIHFYGSVSGDGLRINSLCENIVIEGNKIENTSMDGIKVHQCNKVYVYGNLINNSSLINEQNPAITELEQGIDFVAVANSVIKGNRVLKSGIGMTSKGGSIKITIEGNEFVGPYRWRGITLGENAPGSIGKFTFYSSRGKYSSKGVLIRNNPAVHSGILVASCQNCSLINNTLTSYNVGITQYGTDKTLNVCIENSGPISNGLASSGLVVKTSACPTTFAAGVVVNVDGTIGIDVR